MINKDIVRESISQMENGKAGGPSGVLSENVKATGEAGVDMITELVNQITEKIPYIPRKMSFQISFVKELHN